MSEELLPCPFCGSSEKLQVWMSITARGKKFLPERDSVTCNNCTSSSIRIEVWNTRAPAPISQELRAVLVEARDALESYQRSSVVKHPQVREQGNKALASINAIINGGK